MDDLSNYEEHSIRLQRRADEAMGLFLRTLPESKRALLLKPDEKPRQVGLDHDVAESPLASFEPDIAEEVDGLQDELLEEFRFLQRSQGAPLALFVEQKVQLESQRYNTWLLTRVTARLIEAGNSKMVAVGMAYALSVPVVFVDGDLCRTQMQAARKLGCTRQNLCKEVRKSTEWLGISEGTHLKPQSAIESFKIAQSIDHWRKRLYGH